MTEEELKEKVKACKTEEEAKKLLEENKSELSDDELENVVGGRKGGHSTYGGCSN